MTHLVVKRGEFRATLAALVPLAGKQTDDTPSLGRIRFLPTGDGLVAWTTDNGAEAVAVCEIEDAPGGDADGFDMEIAEAQAALAVIRKPSAKDLAAVWDKEPLELLVVPGKILPDGNQGADHLSLTEVGTLFGARQVKVPLVKAHVDSDGKDDYPDVPANVAAVLRVIEPAGPLVGGRIGALQKLVKAAALFSETVTVGSVENTLIVRPVGGRFVGLHHLAAETRDLTAGNVQVSLMRDFADQASAAARGDVGDLAAELSRRIMHGALQVVSGGKS